MSLSAPISPLHWARSMVSLIVVVLLAVACGGDDEASVDTVPPTSTTSTTSTSTTIAPTTTASTEAPDLVGTPAFDADSSVSTVGIDRITFGMTLNQAKSAVGAELVSVNPGESGPCYQVRPEGGPVGVLLTVNLGTIERVDVTTEMITTRSGAGVGRSEDDLFALFGERLTSTPRPDGTGNTIIFTPVDAGDQQFRVIFETDGSTVTGFRSGRVPLVEAFNPCGS